MKNSIMKVVQCWDDGVVNDLRLLDILRQYEAKATFNLNAGLYDDRQRKLLGVHQGKKVYRLRREEVRKAYEGFTIANHSLTHPRLEQLPINKARFEIVEGRQQLQQFFGQPVLGFAYPYGTYNETIMELVLEAGHVYGRTTGNVVYPFPAKNAMEFHSCCHFLDPDLWVHYENAKKRGVFYFWGHSYEIYTEKMWNNFETIIKRINDDPGSCWGDVADLFVDEKV